MDLMSMLTAKTVDEKPKKKDKKAEKTVVKKEEKPKGKKYKYPFEIYLAAKKRDVSHIFEDGAEYTTDEITKAMLQHGFYEFSGNVTYDYMEKDNVLVPVFQQHKKG